MAKSDVEKRLYDEAVVIDGLNVSNWDSPAVYRSLHRGGITAVNVTVATWEGYLETLDKTSAWLRRIEEKQDILTQVKVTEDILRAKRDGKVGVILGWQNATPIENDLARLALFHRLGVRVIQLTYHERNLLGDGCFERADGGLSGFGVEAVGEMNRLGILIDLSHVGDRTTLEAIELSREPVAFTHANARSYHHHRRNKTDEALKLLAERGGVVGATCIRSFLRNGYDSTIEDYVDAIDYLVEMVGIYHVAIGTDYTQDQPESFWRYIGSQQGTKFPSVFNDGSQRYHEWLNYPPGLETPDKLSNLVGPLLKRGYTDVDIAAVLGGNWLRLFQQVWRD